MGCQGFQRDFAAYLDGELDRSQREAIERHVRACSECRRDLATLRQTVDLLHSPLLSMDDAPGHVRELLSRKIITVRQPISWRDRLFFWRAEGRPRQLVAWGYGMAATALLFIAGTGGLNRFAAPGVHLGVVPGRERPAATVTAPGNNVPSPAASSNRPQPTAARIRAWVESPVVAGRATAIYLFVEPGRDLSDAEVRLYPAADVSVGGSAVLLEDASYLLHRGPLMRGSQQARWISVELRPAQEGIHTMRVVLRDAGRPVAEERVSLTVVAPRE